MVKQLIVVALVLALGFGFVACKDNSTNPDMPDMPDAPDVDVPDAPDAPDVPDVPPEPVSEPPARPNLPG